MIIPAILEQSIEEVQKKVDRVKEFFDRVQIDIIDEGQTITLGELCEINFYHLAVDIHLMTDAPETFLSLCSDIANNVKSVRVIGQIERMADQRSFIQKAHELGLKVGLALDLYTPISSLDFEARKDTDCILLMSVKAGFAGQHFDERVIEKIKELRALPCDKIIVMDGGENPEHIRMSKKAGANEFAVGNYLWEHKDARQALLELEIDETT